MRLLASILLLVIIGWTCLDPLFCLDGCINTTPSSLSLSALSAPDGCCILCHAALGFKWHAQELFRGPSLRQPKTFIAYATLPVPISLIDPPPRA